MFTPAVRWSIWLVFTILWTIGLLLPSATIDRMPLVEDLGDWRIIVAKIIHLLIYSFWTILTAWLGAPLRVRIFLLVFLMAHGVLTEWGQTYPSLMRTGSLRDAAIDHAGVFLGVVLSIRWWAAPDGR